MTAQQLIIGITFFVYLCAMLLIGAYAFRRTRDLRDFILGGRRLGSWVAALSAGASDMSGWLLLGLPGYAYLTGLESLWLGLGLLTGTWLNWRVVAGRLRVYSEQAGDALTLPAFFAHRFRDESGLLRLISAFFILLFFLFYTSSGLVAGGKLFEQVFGLPYIWAVTAGTLTIILYTAFGGFLAVSWTDLVQALLMAAALLLVPIMALAQLGGPVATFTVLSEQHPHLLNAFTATSGEPLTAIAVISLLGWGLGYFGQPHILARFKGIDSSRSVPQARRIAVSWVTLTLAGATLTGLAGIGFLDPPLQGADSEKVFLILVEALFHPVIAGVCLAAVLAAIMSTADSQLLVCSSTFTGDFYRGVFRRDAGERELVWVGRTAVFLIALLAFLLALDPESKVLDLVAYAWAGFGAAFGPPLILSLYWKRMTRNGALAGIIIGGLTVVLWKQLQGGIFELYELVPGWFLSLITVLLVSLAGKAPQPEIQDEFESVATTW